MIIRRADSREPADCALWAEMLARLHGGTAAEFAMEVPGWFTLDEPMLCWLAFTGNGQPIGMIDARKRNYAEDAPNLVAAYVEDLWVEPAHRGQGVARALLGAVEAWARNAGLDWLGSDTAPDNAASRAFHRAAGFTEIEELVVFGKPLV